MVCEEGFYLDSKGELFYLNIREGKLIMERPSGSTCEVCEDFVTHMHRISPDVYIESTKINKKFIKSKLEQLIKAIDST